MDIVSVLTVTLLIISELLPFVHNQEANGILHLILVIIRSSLKVIDEETIVHDDETIKNTGDCHK